ncbi:hypothetical protein [Methylobacterium sp. AMS5]|uniref:hypothetical protein n=1 Tax=Methylobacteriaceae TaxID=119045 RepID=UPI00074F95D2|nr:hypothetical protein [Methylobacterium sp. AMS5]AMB44057.1 hypothetical protein Y590_04050 [Methylobacterium sp. AMS5]
MSKSVVPEILGQLEPWLAERIEAWKNQPADGREATLPATPDGKVNVRGVARALSLRPSQEQHLFRNAELRTAINAVAAEQGLKPVGARADADPLDKVVVDRLKKVQARSGELAKIVAEQAATIERQRNEIRSYREQLSLLAETGQILRTEPPR